MPSLVHENVVSVLVYTVQSMSFSQLTTEANSLLSESQLNQLCFSADPQKQKRGGFKVANPGYLKLPAFAIDHRSPRKLTATTGQQTVCVKQVFYEVTTTSSSRRQIAVYRGPAAMTRVLMELRCIAWGAALLKLVHDFMDAFEKQNGKSLFLDRPNFRFVKTALAIEQGCVNTERRAFLIEEIIDDETEGRFRKYCGNTSPVPFQFPLDDVLNKDRAEFLAFTQHVQYWKTGKLVFVADYQGTYP